MSNTTTTIIILITCLILSINAVRSINESYSVGSVYLERKKQTEAQYLEVIKKKNELDYINSPFFVEKQLRESLNYYRNGEKLLVFTKPVLVQKKEGQSVILKNSYLDEWIKLLKNGISSPEE